MGKPIIWGKKILIGITGGIAAYKSVELIRRLREHGAEVRVVMTQAAQEFITSLTLQAVSGQPVFTQLFGRQTSAGMDHIALASWPDLILIAPVSANTIARLACGQADDLLSTIYLATRKPIAIAPAMNTEMWLHAATQDNVRRLQARGGMLWGPAVGEQACGAVGLGCLLEPDELITFVETYFAESQILMGKKVMVTAGPTQELLDPVRYLSNRSSGKMGYALAQAAVEAGAEVILVSGPCHLPIPQGVSCLSVTSAQQMEAAVMQHVVGCDIFIGAAAVSDYRAESIATKKIKKSTEIFTVVLKRNPDIIAQVVALENKPFVVGFAAETDHEIEYARVKLQTKSLDMLVANLVSDTRGFEQDDNEVVVIQPDQTIEKFALAPKRIIAKQLMILIARTTGMGVVALR
ncbi:MAG: phosphopantothenoylcysteine decarboxylase [Coxiella sp. RIFCSPHIGHO2_12_FULL_44_14]|nr:MAG: phosphopantothenoylcysteine decarboxylase [Coxiella sp. RIFCSPHIGHO2_12_FULL_44_14]